MPDPFGIAKTIERMVEPRAVRASRRQSPITPPPTPAVSTPTPPSMPGQ